jgi:hypothetical protein
MAQAQISSSVSVAAWWSYCSSGCDGTAMTNSPAARAARMPMAESSKATDSVEITPRSPHALEYTSASGFGRSASSAETVIRTSLDGPERCNAMSSSSRGLLLATAIGTFAAQRRTRPSAPGIGSA